MLFRRRKKYSLFAVPVVPRQRRRKINWRLALGIFSAILVFSGLFYLLIWSPVFKIKAWNVESTNLTVQTQVEEAVVQFFRQKFWRIVPADSWLTFFSWHLERTLLAAFPEVATVKIEKNILKGVKVVVDGRQPAAFWCQVMEPIVLADQATTTGVFLPQSEECFFIDSQGLLFREAPTISGAALPTFFDATGKIGLGDKAVASSTIQFASQLKKQLRDADVETVGVALSASGNPELVIFAEEGWQAYFDLTRLPQPQAQVLLALLAEELKEKRAGLKYVDLRVAGKVYYR